MERLTKRINDVVTYIGTENEYDTGMIAAETASSVAAVREILLRLAAYEDTGREPEEVTALGKLFDYALEESKTLTEQLTLLKHIRELAEADKDGRVVVLPCKVGDTAYYLNGPFIIDFEVIGYQVDERGAWCFQGEHFDEETEKTYYCDPSTDKIGQTVFLTRDEAERAMEGKT